MDQERTYLKGKADYQHLTARLVRVYKEEELAQDRTAAKKNRKWCLPKKKL